MKILNDGADSLIEALYYNAELVYKLSEATHVVNPDNSMITGKTIIISDRSYDKNTLKLLARNNKIIQRSKISNDHPVSRYRKVFRNLVIDPWNTAPKCTPIKIHNGVIYIKCYESVIYPNVMNHDRVNKSSR